MSKEYSKRSYTCYCGMDYGTCEGESYFILMYNGVSDITRIIHRAHIGSNYESTEDLGHFTDEQLSALSKILSGVDIEVATSEDINLLRSY